MKKCFLIMAAALMAGLSLTSCLESTDSSSNTYTLQGYFTITGSASAGYTFYEDGGGIIVPDASSVSSVTGGSGFGNHHRAIFYIQYTQSMISTDGNTITGGTIASGQYMAEDSIYTQVRADEKGISKADSLYNVTSFDALWAYNGYLNTSVTASYAYVNGANIAPSTYLVCDTASVANDAITLNLLYNRHALTTDVSGGSTTTYSSFYLDNLNSLVPGDADSITVTVHCEGCEDRGVSIARSDMRHKH